MHPEERRKRMQAKEGRMVVVAELYKKGWSIRKIAEETRIRMNLEKLAHATVANDIKSLLTEWRKSRINDTDLLIQLELERIDDTIAELWDQWEKSKTDFTKESSKKKGKPEDGKKGEQVTVGSAIKTFLTEKSTTLVRNYGNSAYIAEIRAQLVERRKLLGLYAPERKEVTGKDGKPLVEKSGINLDDLTAEERKVLLEIARNHEQIR